MVEFCFEYKIANVPVTTLVKADCRIVKWDYSVVKEYGALTHIGYGVYVMTEILFAEEQCRVQIYRDSAWVDCTFGIVTLGHSELNYVSKAAPEITADLDCNSHKLTEVANGAASTDAVNKSQLDALGTTVSTNYLLKTSGAAQTIANDVAFEKFPTKTSPYTHPTGDGEFTTKAYVDSEISQIQVAPFQESANKVRVCKGGHQEEGKVYTTIENALAYFSTAGENKQCMILIEGTGVTDKTITVIQTQFVNYVHLTGAGKHIHLILGGSSGNITSNCRLSNMTLIMGAGVITGDRVYNTIQFDNCLILAYKNLTLTNVKMNNCIVLQPSGKSVTVNGSSEITNCIFNQAANLKELTGFAGNNTVEANTSYSLPTDPTLPV